MDYQDDQIDLRPYIQALIKNIWLIVIVAALFAIATFVVTRTQTEQYRSTAILLLTRTRSVLSLASQFPTVTEPIDARSRMDALTEIANSDAIAKMTLESLSDILPENIQTIEEIKKITAVQSKGDSINVSATTQDPDLSANIANIFASNLAEAINLAYSGEQPLSNIQEQLNTAENDYNEAQLSLENFIRENKKKELETRSNEANSLLSSYGNEDALQIAYYINRKQAMLELQDQASALKQQLENGNRSTAGNIGDALAVILARMNAILSKTVNTGASGSTNNVLPQQNALVNLQIDQEFPADGTAGYSADIDAIIKLAEEEKNKAEENIQQLVQGISSPDPSRLEQIASAAAEIQSLEQQIEVQKAAELELTSNRDLAWQAYQALAQKETELKNVALTSNQINLASPAIPPLEPESKGTLQKVLIAGIAGAMLAVIWVVVAKWWRSANEKDAG